MSKNYNNAPQELPTRHLPIASISPAFDRSIHPKVLVLMAARNGSAWVLQQIRSIFAQKDTVIDLAVSDDHSTDDTRARLTEAAAHGRLQTLSPPAPTGSAAQNFLWLMRCAPLTDHEYIALADQDDVWDPEKIGRAYRALRESGAAGYSSAVTAVWSDGRQLTLAQVSTPTQSDFLFEGAGQGCTFVLTAAFFREVRSFLETEPSCLLPVRYHDWALYALARSWRKTWYFDPRTSMQYRQHLANDTGARKSLAGVNKRFVLIKDGWYRCQLSAIAAVCATAAPGDALIAEWNQLLRAPRGLTGRVKIALFCCRGGRRRRLDNAVLVAAAIAGWI